MGGFSESSLLLTVSCHWDLHSTRVSKPPVGRWLAACSRAAWALRAVLTFLRVGKKEKRIPRRTWCAVGHDGTFAFWVHRGRRHAFAYVSPVAASGPRGKRWVRLWRSWSSPEAWAVPLLALCREHARASAGDAEGARAVQGRRCGRLRGPPAGRLSQGRVLPCGWAPACAPRAPGVLGDRAAPRAGLGELWAVGPQPPCSGRPDVGR